MNDQHRLKRFPKAEEDISTSRHVPDTPQTRSPSYRLAFADGDFLTRDELRPVRLQLELLKPELTLTEAGITSTIVVFGGARIPPPDERDNARTETLAGLSDFYEQAREFARLCTIESVKSGGREDVIISGGGPGVMEAACLGAEEAGGVSISLNIVLPHEQAPNLYATPEYCFNFHYFGIRKMHFLMRAKAVTVFPGGFGTLDELFETLTLVQTGRMEPLPILLFGREFWERIVDWQALADAGTIGEEDLNLLQFVDTAEEAFEIIQAWDAGAAPKGSRA